MSTSSRPTSMLLLAAIDMLTAALVCGVVLFVVLVGGQSESEAANRGAADLSAPSVVELVTTSTALPDIPDAERRITTALKDRDDLAKQYLSAPLWVTSYYLKPGVHALSLQGVSSPLELIIHDGTGPVIRVVLRCGLPASVVFVDFLPRPRLQGECSAPAQPPTALAFAASTQIAVLRQDDQRTQIPSGWNRTDFADLADGSRQMRLQATAPASLPPEIRMLAVY